MYLNKYLKYKTKYLDLKNKMYGGTINKQSKQEDVIAAVKINGLELNNADDKFKKNITIVSIAIEQNLEAIKFVKDSKVLLEVITQKPEAIKFVTDSKLLLAAITQNGDLLQYIPDNLKTKDLINAAIKQNGDLLQYIPDSLITQDLINAAIANKLEAIKHLKSIEKILIGIKKNNASLLYITNEDPTIQNGIKQYIIDNIKKNPQILGNLSDVYKNNKDIVFEAIKLNGESLGYALSKDNKVINYEVLLTAANNSPKMYSLAISKLKTLYNNNLQSEEDFTIADKSLLDTYKELLVIGSKFEKKPDNLLQIITQVEKAIQTKL
jgi:hypothetical protein